jgi:hypothetical protein
VDAAAAISLAWLLAYALCFALPAVLVARRRASFAAATSLALGVATFALVGFGIVDGIGVGAAILPFGLVAMGALAGSRDGARWIAGAAAILALALAALMRWGPLDAVARSTIGPAPPAISSFSWLAWATAVVALAVATRRWTLPLCGTGAALLWAGVAVGPGVRTYSMSAAAVVATASVLAALVQRKVSPPHGMRSHA